MSKKFGIKVVLFGDEIPPFFDVSEEDIDSAISKVETLIKQEFPNAAVEVVYDEDPSGVWSGVEVFESSAIDTDFELEIEESVNRIKQEFLSSQEQAG